MVDLRLASPAELNDMTAAMQALAYPALALVHLIVYSLFKQISLRRAELALRSSSQFAAEALPLMNGALSG